MLLFIGIALMIFGAINLFTSGNEVASWACITMGWIAVLHCEK